MMSKLTFAAITAAFLATGTTANADQGTTKEQQKHEDQKRGEEQKRIEHQKKLEEQKKREEHKRPEEQKKREEAPKKGKEQKGPSGQNERAADANKLALGEPSQAQTEQRAQAPQPSANPQPPAEEVNRKADTAADEANKKIVGEQQQRENEERARQAQPAEPTKEEQQRRAKAEQVGRTTTTAAETVMRTTEEATRAAEVGKYNPFAIEVNPLGLVVGGRVSLNFEYAPVTHHVLVLSPHFVNTSADISVAENRMETHTFTGGGTEIGYRYYTGTRGMNGIFVGPSLIGGVFNASLPSGNTSFTNIGVAADVGYQQVFFNHLALGAGIGVEYLRVSEKFGDLPAGPSAVASTGLKPRLLAQAGYAF